MLSANDGEGKEKQILAIFDMTGLFTVNVRLVFLSTMMVFCKYIHSLITYTHDYIGALGNNNYQF